MSQVVNETAAEQNELEWLLTSGVLGRSHNLAHMLKFICDKHFQGHPEEITEYTVATEALGRRTEFDPQTDTIVRVTTHTLRKRLHEIYQREGSTHPVHIVIPLGQYAPSFVHSGGAIPVASQPAIEEAPGGEVTLTARGPKFRFWGIAAIVLVAAVLLGALPGSC